MSLVIKGLNLPSDGTYSLHLHIVEEKASLKWFDNTIYEIIEIPKEKERNMAYMMDGWQTDIYINEIEKNTEVTQKSKSKTINPPAAVGWICPKCGAGLAPWALRCPCQDKWEITY